ncbi:MAG: methylated-DNA--[protein]-cysteine S-methyltransferase [Halanaeroarchaeum sp.]
MRKALGQLDRHDAPMPTDDTILLEAYGREMVLTAHFGHAVNETLGRVLSALLGQRTGSSVGMEIDPYRIELTVPRGVSLADVLETLREVPYGEQVSVEQLTRMTPDLDAENDDDRILVRTALDENPAPLLIPDHRVRNGPSAAPPGIEQKLRSLEGL